MAAKSMEPHSPVVDAVERPRPVNSQYARQGKRNMSIVWVLAISLALAALATFGAWATRAPDLAGPGGQSARDGASVSQTPGTARQSSNDPVPVTEPEDARRNAIPYPGLPSAAAE